MNNVTLEGRIITKPKIFENCTNEVEVQLFLEVERQNDEYQAIDIVSVIASEENANVILENFKLNDFLKIIGNIRYNLNPIDSLKMFSCNCAIEIEEIIENSEEELMSIEEECSMSLDEITIF